MDPKKKVIVKPAPDATDWKAKYEHEHALRCDLERRFDFRVAGVGVVTNAMAKIEASIDDPQKLHDVKKAVGAVVLWAQSMVSYVPTEKRLAGWQGQD